MRIFACISMRGLLSGCATIIEGTSQSVAVLSDPTGASCNIDREGQRLGQVSPTPGSLRVDKSKNDITVTCSREGYQSAVISQSPKFVGTTFGNIIAGGLIGVAVDASTGANYEYPKEIHIPLAPAASAVSVNPAMVVPASAVGPASASGILK